MLTLDPIQENTISNRNPFFQDWPMVSQSEYFYSQQYDFGEITNPNQIEITIKDVIGLPSTSQYSEFRLKTTISYSPINSPAFVNETSLNSALGNIGSVIPITENGKSWVFTPQFLNFINFIIYYNYQEFKLYINFSIEGKTSSNVWEEITFFKYTLLLITSRCLFRPVQSIFSYVLNSNIFGSKDFKADGTPWRVRNIPNLYTVLILSGNGIVSLVNNNYRITGSGLCTFRLTLNSLANNSSIGTTSNSIFLDYFNTGINAYSNLQIYFITLKIDSFFVNTQELYFEATKGVTEPETQYIPYFSGSTITLNIPLFLNATLEEIIIDGVSTTVIAVKPISFEYLESGIYTGAITVRTIVSGVEETKNIPIVYLLKAFINIPFSDNSNFTLDNQPIELATLNENTFFNINILATVYDFYTDLETVSEMNLKVPLFKKKGMFFIGETIHKLMKSFTNLVTNQWQYNLAQVALTITEKNYGGLLIREIPAGTYPFVAGLTPNNKILLSINNNITRIYAKQALYINLLLDKESYYYGLFKDNIELTGYQRTSFTVQKKQVYTVNVNFLDYTIFQGDLITFRLFNRANQVIAEKQFGVLPSGEYHNNITFEDTYKCKSNFVFSGEFDIESEFSRISNRVMRNNFEALNHLQIDEKPKLTINTGWIFKNDQITIKELVKSKRAFLQYGDTMLELRPLNDKMINENSDDNLVEYAVQFEIIQKKHAQTYTYTTRNHNEISATPA